MDQPPFRTPLPRILTVGDHSFAGLRLWLKESLSLRWTFIYGATTAGILGLVKLCAPYIRIGGATDPVVLAEYSATVQNSILLTTALWAVGLPFVSHLAAKALGGKGRFRDDVVNAGRSGAIFVPAWALVLVLFLRGSLWGPLLGMALLVPLLGFLGLNFIQHRFQGWRTWAMQGVIVAYSVLLLVGYFMVPLFATGYPWDIAESMNKASAPALHPFKLASHENAATAYAAAGATQGPKAELFMEGARRAHADFMPDALTISRDSTTSLDKERAAAAEMIEEANRLHRSGELAEAGRRYRAVLAFTRHLAEQVNDRVYFQAVRMHIIGQLFSPLAAFASEEGLSDDEARLLLASIRSSQLGPEAIADALENGYRLDQIVRTAYLQHVLSRFYSADLRRSPAQDLERLLQDDIAAARRAALANDSQPIVERTTERKKLFAPLEGTGGRPGSFQCVWNPDALARCAYYQGPSTDYKDMPALFAMATARLRILEATLSMRLDPAFAQKLPEDPFSPGSPLRLSGGLWKTRRAYSIGPDRKDQGGKPLLFDPSHWTALPEGDIAADLSAAWRLRYP